MKIYKKFIPSVIYERLSLESLRSFEDESRRSWRRDHGGKFYYRNLKFLHVSYRFLRDEWEKQNSIRIKP